MAVLRGIDKAVCFSIVLLKCPCAMPWLHCQSHGHSHEPIFSFYELVKSFPVELSVRKWLQQ